MNDINAKHVTYQLHVDKIFPFPYIKKASYFLNTSNISNRMKSFAMAGFKGI
jgi:hypothetical protein